MRIQLSDDEWRRLSMYIPRLNQLREEVTRLGEQGSEIVDIINTAFRDASRRVKLTEESMMDVEIPQMINAHGQLVVNLNSQDKTAEWQSAHDIKRVASDVLAVQETSDKEKGNGNERD